MKEEKREKMDHEDKLKHLEFIEDNIARMNKCSFQMKGWTITLVSALLAVFATTLDKGITSKVNVILVFIGIFPTIFFGYQIQVIY